MQYHEIGKTGMKVSSLSFGASSLGGVFHDLKEKEGIQAVFTAVEAGMNFRSEERRVGKECRSRWSPYH